MPDAANRLIVFSDDWGRHPSSCQHLIRHLLPKYPTLWVNTIGTRRPTLSWHDFRRVWNKLFRPADAVALPANLRVVSPRMWPGFRSPWQRRFNTRAMVRTIHDALGPRRAGEKRVAVTTLPITADLVGKLDVDRWIYYCVDDFSVWPGLDGNVMNEMEREQAGKVDAAVAVSESLQQRLMSMGRSSMLLTHGIDLDHWSAAAEPAPIHGATRPIYLFWGLIDARLDMSWCKALADGPGPGTLVLIGPQQDPPPELLAMKNVVMPGPLPYEKLPAAAAAADVLVMPYADLPVTRAMQPLKFKEYLAAGFPARGKPVVVRKLPATAGWGDCADVVETAEDFVRCVKERAASGLPASQREARVRRLPGESWSEKSRQFEGLFI